MKKICLFFLFCFVPLVASAQYSKFYDNTGEVKGSFSLPDTVKYLVLKFDFSETVFDKKYNEEDWALLNGKENWEAAKKEALERIVKMMNEKMTKTRIIMVLEEMATPDNPKIQSNYTFYIVPLSYSKLGRNRSVFVLKNNVTNDFVGCVSDYGSGANFGSLGNLLGDAYEDSAPRVAKKIASYNKFGK